MSIPRPNSMTRAAIVTGLLLTKKELRFLSNLLSDAFYDYGYDDGEHTAAEKRMFTSIRRKVVEAAK